MWPRKCKPALVLTASLALLVCGRSVSGAELDCKTFVAGFVSWARANIGVNAVGAKMGAVKVRESNPTTYPWGHGSYSEGRLGLHGNDLEGRFKVLFSDRKAPAGKFRFDPGRADIQDIRLFADGRVRILLRSWGDTSLSLGDVKCYSDGFLTGVKREANGVSMVTLLLRKEVMMEGKDGFRDWP
jgi:hypothetical protein